MAEQAGMSFATIYKHFGDKENLLFSFIDDWLLELHYEVELGLKGLDSVREKIRKLLWCHLDYYERNPKVGRILFMTVPTHTWMQTNTFAYREFVEVLVEIIKSGQHAKVIRNDLPILTALDFLVGALVRTFVMWQYRGCTYKLVDQFEPLFGLVWSGVGSNE